MFIRLELICFPSASFWKRNIKTSLLFGPVTLRHCCRLSSFLFSVWILLIGMLSSLLNMLWDITLYHVILDGKEQDLKWQLKLLPYYGVHFAFRSITMATFFIYWKVRPTELQPSMNFVFTAICNSHCGSAGPLQYVADKAHLQLTHWTWTAPHQILHGCWG